MELKIDQPIKYYWHGKVLLGYVAEIDSNSITVRDTI